MAFVTFTHPGFLKPGFRCGKKPSTDRRQMLSRSFPVPTARPVTASASGEEPSETSYLLRDSQYDHDGVTSDRRNPEDVEHEKVQQAEAPTGTRDEPSPPGLVQITDELDLRVLFGEFLSTFIFVYLSVNAAALGSPLSNSLNNAAIIAAVAGSYMPVSGAHLNPAVTLALLVAKRVSLRRAVAFVPVQLMAASAACLMAQALGVTISFPGIPIIVSQTELLRNFFAELVPMFIIVSVVFQTAVATEQEGGVGNKLAALYIGLAVLACAGTFLTGVFNPARAFGPALVAGNFAHHWIYWVGPCVGAVLAALISEHLFLAPSSKRPANSLLSDVARTSNSLAARVKSLGLAGLISYGIMNIVYYGTVFSYMMVKVGASGGAGGITKAWLVTWSFSQVTKPLRLALSVALAPFVDRVLKKRGIGNNRQ